MIVSTLDFWYTHHQLSPRNTRVVDFDFSLVIRGVGILLSQHLKYDHTEREAIDFFPCTLADPVVLLEACKPPYLDT